MQTVTDGYFMCLNAVLEECHNNSVRGGWWLDPVTGLSLLPFSHEKNADHLIPYVIATKIALIHSEVSEALEGYRTDAMDDKLFHRRAIEVELADIIIRVGDLANALGLDLGETIKEKFKINATRADHKIENRKKPGGKKF